MVFSGIAALNENDIAVLDVNPMIRHTTATERLCQSRYSGAVSDPGLVIYVGESKPPGELGRNPAFFTKHVGAAHE